MEKKIISTGGFEYIHKIDYGTDEELSTRHCHDSYEILYVIDGEGRYLIEGAEFAMCPKTLVLIRPFEYHCVEVAANTNYERFVLHFSPADLESDVIDKLECLADSSKGESGNFYSSDALMMLTVSLFERFEYAEELSASDRDVFMRLLLSEIIMLLSTSGNERIAHDEGELGAKVARFINDYLDKDVSLDVISKRFFVSKYYLCRTFKKYSGVSIHAYITHKRVLYAKQLIESGETASGAAYKVGFGDYSAFYRAYVKVLGKPPTSK